MKRTLEKGGNAIQKICDQLRKETLEPAEKEAERIQAEALAEAERIIAEAKSRASTIEREGHRKIEQERSVFLASLKQAVQQSLEALRQAIEKELFSNQLPKLAEKELKDPKVIASLIKAIVEGVSREGIESDLSAIIPKTVSKEAVNQLLAKQVVEALREKGVVVGEIAGGAQVKLHQAELICEMSDRAVCELLSRYVRKEFRGLLFGQ